MLKDAYMEMTALTQMDQFCREHFLRTGEYMSKPSIEEIRTLLEMWGKLDHVMSEKDLGTKLDAGNVEGLNTIFDRESLFFEEGQDISILCANRYFAMKEHRHQYFEIECVFDGTAIHDPGKKQTFLKEGDIVLIPPGTKHNTQPVDSSTVVDLEIRMSTFEKTFRDILDSELPISAFFKKAFYEDGPHECVILEGMLDEEMRDILCLIWQESKNRSFVSGKMSVHLVQALLYHLADAATKDHIFEMYDYRNEEMYQIRKYIYEHMEDVTLSELARHFHRSDPAISRYIKSHGGKGFSELLQGIRLEKAADLLLAGNTEISQIAFLVGYSTVSHFISCFRKRYGMTPLQYRRTRTANTRE